MRAARVASLLGVAVITTLGLLGCTREESLARHVDGDTIDIAFCREFDADSVRIEFGDYRGTLTTTATRVYTGPRERFGAGVPISTSMSGWALAPDGDAVPQDWDRIDYSFYDSAAGAAISDDDADPDAVYLDDDVDDGYVGGEFLFHDEVHTTEWAWRAGAGVNAPTCALRLG